MAYYPSIPASDGTSMEARENSEFQVFELADTTFTTPLPLLSPAGTDGAPLVTTAQGVVPPVNVVSPNLSHNFKSGEWVWRRDSFDEAEAATQEARDAASASASAAQASAYAAIQAASNAVAPTSTAVQVAITTPGTAANIAVTAAAEQAAATAAAPKIDRDEAATAISTAVAPKLGKDEAAATYAPAFKKGRIRAGDGALGALPDTYNTGATATVVAFGYEALGNAEQVKQSIAIGTKALGTAKMSRDNIAIGDQALYYTQSDSPNYDQAQKAGTRNIAIGGLAGHFINKGWAHTVIGRGAGQCIESGTGLVAIGANAASGFAPVGFTGEVENWSPWNLADNQVVKTVLVGNSAGTLSTGPNNVAVGGSALLNSKKSNYNVAVGSDALRQLDEGTGPNGGREVLANIGGTYTHAGNVVTVTLTASHTLVVGDIAYTRLTDGDSATFQGDQARAFVTSVPNARTYTVRHPTPRTASGNALYMGKETAEQMPRSETNVAIGGLAGGSLKTGSENVIVGDSAVSAAVNAVRSTVVGKQALFRASNIDRGTVVGYYAAGFIGADANEVTAVGANAMRAKVDGSTMTESWSNITALGNDSRVSGPNQVQLGDSRTATYVYGTVQNRSDSRDKADIRDTKLGLEFIEKLRPVDYRWDMREDYFEEDSEGNLTPIPKDGSKKRTRYHHGFIAQEVQQVIEETGVDFGGLQDHSKNGGSEVLSIGYDEVIAPLVKAVQELTARVKELEAGQPPQWERVGVIPV